jgi:hypothetical protein
MSVSSISSSSVWWEEYVERQKKLQQQTTREVVSNGASGIANVPVNPEELLAELQSLQDDPEKLKARAAEMAVQVANEAENANGPHANMLKELSSDLNAIAADGDLSALEEKVTQASSRAKPAGMKLAGLGGMSGGTSASIKWIEALVEDEEDDDDELTLSETLAEYLAELEENAESSDEADTTEDTAAQLQTRLMSRLLEIYGQRQAQYSTLGLTA